MKDADCKKNGGIRKMAGSGLNDWRSQSLKIKIKI